MAVTKANVAGLTLGSVMLLGPVSATADWTLDPNDYDRPTLPNIGSLTTATGGMSSADATNWVEAIRALPGGGAGRQLTAAPMTVVSQGPVNES